MPIPYDVVFVHSAQMVRKEDGTYVFLAEDKAGFLHGETRVKAAQILWARGLIRQLVAVGGPTKDGASKAKLIADLLGYGAIPLETQPYTQSNIEEIKRFLGDRKGRFGLLTNFYHIPRAIRMATENGVNLIPICAESVLMAADMSQAKQIEEWYGSASMLRRMLFEIQGLRDLEGGEYLNPPDRPERS